MRSWAVGLVAFMSTGTAAERCPAVASIQSDYVLQSFDISKVYNLVMVMACWLLTRLQMGGVYYELAYHDYTQPIGVCDCQRSKKWYVPEEKKLYDDFSLRCAGAQYMNHM